MHSHTIGMPIPHIRGMTEKTRLLLTAIDEGICMPFVLMNTFYVASEKAEQFEQRCRRPSQHMHDVPGLEDFQLMRGQADNGTIAYVASSTWSSKQAMEAWRQSDAYRQLLTVTRLPASMLCRRPERACFEVVSRHGHTPVGNGSEFE